jgi:hypothetical protein
MKDAKFTHEKKPSGCSVITWKIFRAEKDDSRGATRSGYCTERSPTEILAEHSLLAM